MKRVLVVDPTHTLTFLKLGASRISSVVDRFLKEEDDVLKRALASLEGMPPTQAGVFVAAIAYATLRDLGREVDANDVFAMSFVQTLYDAVPDLAEDEFEEIADDHEKGDVDDEEDEGDGLNKDAGEERDNRARFVADMEQLVDTVFEQTGSSGDVIKLLPDYSRPIQALLLDANVRYGYEEEEAIRFVFGMLDVMGRYGLYLPGEEEEISAI